MVEYNYVLFIIEVGSKGTQNGVKQRWRIGIEKNSLNFLFDCDLVLGLIRLMME
jgi:hypothetical protein